MDQKFLEQKLKSFADNLKTEWSQLLLEENTWVAPVRIQTLAQQELGMRIPEMKNTVLLTKSI